VECDGNKKGQGYGGYGKKEGKIQIAMQETRRIFHFNKKKVIRFI
jgi:hypothetical protein